MTGIHDRGSGPYRDGVPDKPELKYQVVLNEAWPPMRPGDTYLRGREYDDKPPDQHVDVDVRCELERDGVIWLPGRATRWHQQHVYVVTNDPRIRGGLWVLAGDVRRR